jgi:hypothetical protein
MPASRAVGAAEWVLTVAAAAIIAIAAVGLALFPVTTPAAVESLVWAVGSNETAGVSSQAVYRMAEAVRLFVVDRSAPGLPAAVEGSVGFDEAAVSHLVDVREVLIPARQLTLALAILAAVWIALGLRRGGRLGVVVGRSLVCAGAALLVTGALALIAGALDFDGLFAWFHGLFFADGTWTFPDSALLIRVFPLPFWIAAGALWGGLVVAAAAALVLVGRSHYFTECSDGV